MTRLLFLFLGSWAAGLIASALVDSTADPTRARIWVCTSLVAALTLALFQTIRSNRRVSLCFYLGDRVLNKGLALTVGWLLVGSCATLTMRLGVIGAEVFLQDLLWLLPAVPFLVLGYIVLVESLRGASEDEYSSFGALLRGKGHWDTSAHKRLVLGWIVKAFFIPLMYGNLVLNVERLLALGVPTSTDAWIVWFFVAGLTIDLLVATIGYISAGKLFRNEPLSIDDSLLGWVACLACYAPFFQYVQKFTAQRDSLIWSDWLAPTQPLYWVWAAALVTAWSVHWLSFIAFGMRFSNLTYRGLIDRGPYRFCKLLPISRRTSTGGSTQCRSSASSLHATLPVISLG